MATGTETEQGKIDVRVYIGMVLFRWQVIVFCFLYSLLGGVLYIHLVPKEYLTRCKVMIYRDPNLVVSSGSGPWRSFSIHSYLLQSEKLRQQAVKTIEKEWGPKMGSPQAMLLYPNVAYDGRIGSTIDVSLKSRNYAYAEAFLTALMEQHEQEWKSIQKAASDTASGMLDGELTRLEEKIKTAEDDVIEYQRLHDIPRAEAKGSKESAYLSALMDRHNQLSTELMLLEAQSPQLKGENVGVIGNVAKLTRETGTITPIEDEEPLEGEGEAERKPAPVRKAAPKLPPGLAVDNADEGKQDESMGWQDLRVKLVRLQQKEKDLQANLEPEHRELRAVRKEIENIKNQLVVAAEIQLGNLKDRHKALTIQVNAVEAAESKWSAKNMLATQRRGEFKRLAAVTGRFEANYNLLYSRLHDMRVSEELKAEHFRTIEPVKTLPDPVWPDPMKILLVSLVIGLGSGFGLALVSQVFDNKVQTITDVEKVLGVPFLGGVPYWVHSGLEKAIRPIVTEEHSTGAIEAYRALRTNILAAMVKLNEKVLIVTSADSKEGKTLTTLNLAIMIAQMNKKVLLVDMDVRRGRLHRSLNVEKEPGVTDVLQRGKSIKDVVRSTRFENLFFVSSGSSIDNSAELLQSSDIPGMFTPILDDYDYILIDTSPVLRVTDTVIIASQGTGAVLYVARVNRTPKPLIRYSLDMLKDARVIGLVMNSIEMHKISSRYYAYQSPNYAYYSNAYAYGYDYYYYSDQSGKGGPRLRRGSWEKTRHDLGRWFRRTFLPME